MGEYQGLLLDLHYRSQKWIKKERIGTSLFRSLWHR